MKQAARVSLGALVIVVAAVIVWAVELPDSELNPATGNIETVDAPAEEGNLVRHVVDPGKGASHSATTISTHAANAPRIAIKTAGDTWVVWWRDTFVDHVYLTIHDLQEETWSPEQRISESTEESRYPEIVHDASAAWIVYQIDTGSGSEIAGLSIIDSPDPWSTRTIIASSTATGDLDVRIHTEDGHVWTTWVDSTSDVGWSEYDAVAESWELPQYESYAASDVPTARANIRATVLGP